ncbi:XRE family transcriptional regulator [Streptococcus sp. 68]|uniref:helix-turn-helix domain-containing protein n=1 Tax=Streptococcus sp. 68 TaxID=2582637 RepID=UPI00156615D7|nr:XRE family transcriptional regulator [Streptococcus sp. 68]
MREFGEKIKRLRLAKEISRSEFCGDESELSIRQLIRIENGESRPTLTKLKYIAERLGVEDYKLMPSYIELDKEYLELKYFLMRTPTYEDETIAQKKESVFDKIFEEYYDRLPEEERFIIDVLQAYDDFGWWNDDSNLGMILQEYFDHILLKSKYEVNDILIIKLFLVRLVHQDTIIDEIEVNTFLVIADKILQQVEMFDIEYSFLIRDSLLLLLGIFEKIANYSQFEDILYKLNEITSKSYDYQKKPIIRLWEWRYALFVKKDYSVAENYFQEAKIFARMIDNSHLIEQLEKQWQHDLQDFFKNKH